ncbi:hypothetical protein DXV75_09035 [Alteromonas aestuariivivens]|uniref:Uncharacterized protein n=1 Tax=Alteromonas aestuariivivens TaxID=1938339 RepID=A0A3D8M6U0_9ALTE|nr:BNR-4 repeat-containing protein [Alteromonas aestuariivivens]RDV25438.1 hypothetical protein DXV75_09035 [Alteromonas aestuariivivens]
MNLLGLSGKTASYLNEKKRLFNSLASALVISALAGCANDNAVPQQTMVDYFADNGLSNAVAPIQHPAGEYHNGITYVAYQGLLEDPYLAAYNHNTKQWSGPFKAGVSDMGKDPTRDKIDNHGKPAMIIDDEGYIHVAFGGHGGVPELGENKLGNYHYGRQQHAVSKRPYDISEWETLNNVSPFGTYNQWVKMDNGDLYLFYRHGAHRSNWVYQKSTDNGRTFGEPVSVLKTKRRDDAAGVDAWYAWFTKGPNNTILAAVTYHMCWDNTPTKTHDGERRNGYYLYMNTLDGDWHNVQGEVLDVPLTKEDADAKALVVDSGELWANRGTTQIGPDGYPYVSFRMGEHLGRKHGGPQNFYFYRWDGQQWVSGPEPLPVSRGDFKVPSSSTVNMVLAVSDADNTGVVESGSKKLGVVGNWQSNDGGLTFSRQKVYLSVPGTGFAITSIIRNAHPNAQVLVAGIVPGTDYRKMYLVGEDGPVQRPLEEASLLE